MIIGLTGRAFSGKDTVGRYLARAHNFSLFAFADPIRDGLSAAFGLPPSVYRPENKEEVIEALGKSPDQLAKIFETQFAAALYPTVWNDLMEARILHSMRAGDCDIVVIDVCTRDKAELILRLGGQLWRIHRPDSDTTTYSSHVSETEIEDLHAQHYLMNDGTLEQLHEAVDGLLFPIQEAA